MRDASGAQFVRATMAAATSSAGQRLLPSYKQHTSVDDRAGVIVDIEVVTGEEADFGGMVERPDAVEATLGRRTGTVTADKAYGIAKVYAAQSERPSGTGPVGPAQSERDIAAVIPLRPSTRQAKAKGFTTRRIRYDAARDIVRCPRKKVMTPRSATKSGRWFRAGADACRTCPLRARLACPMAAPPGVSISPGPMLMSCVLAEKGWRGVATKPTSTPFTAGWSKTCIDWPKPCTGWPEPPGADLKT